MRSKEVEEAINRIVLNREFLLHNRETAIFPIKDINTTLNYIQELEVENADAKEYADEVWRQNQELRIENETNYEKACDKFNEDLKKILAQDVEVDYVPKQVIRDKIKELEEDGIWITEDYYFNEELGDEYPICKTNFSKEEMQDVVKDILKEILGE